MPGYATPRGHWRSLHGSLELVLAFDGAADRALGAVHTPNHGNAVARSLPKRCDSGADRRPQNDDALTTCRIDWMLAMELKRGIVDLEREPRVEAVDTGPPSQPKDDPPACLRMQGLSVDRIIHLLEMGDATSLDATSLAVVA